MLLMRIKNLSHKIHPPPRTIIPRHSSLSRAGGGRCARMRRACRLWWWAVTAAMPPLSAGPGASVRSGALLPRGDPHGGEIAVQCTRRLRQQRRSRACSTVATEAHLAGRVSAALYAASPTWHCSDGQTLSLHVKGAQLGLAQPGSLGRNGARSHSTGGEEPAPKRADAPDDVLVVDNRADAEAVVKLLLSQNAEDGPQYHAVDTEVCANARSPALLGAKL